MDENASRDDRGIPPRPESVLAELESAPDHRAGVGWTRRVNGAPAQPVAANDALHLLVVPSVVRHDVARFFGVTGGSTDARDRAALDPVCPGRISTWTRRGLSPASDRGVHG